MNVRMEGARPDQRERQREVDLALPAGALAMHEALPGGSGLCAGHAGPEHTAHVLHGGSGDLVGQAHALDLLLRLERARRDEERGGVRGIREGVEPGAAERRRLSDHAVGGLRAAAQLDGHALVACGNLDGELERTQAGRAGIDRVVAGKEAHIGRPCSARCVVGRSLEADQHGLALAGEDARVIALHTPEVGQVEDGVGRAHDERVELTLRHERAHARQLGLVTPPDHQRTRGGAGSPWPSCHEITGLRNTPMCSISHSITSPGLR